MDSPEGLRQPFEKLRLSPQASHIPGFARSHESERIAVHGREVYAWHPDGVARSKLWNALAGKGLGVTATARNWTTVCKLLEMADG